MTKIYRQTALTPIYDLYIPLILTIKHKASQILNLLFKLDVGSVGPVTDVIAAATVES